MVVRVLAGFIRDRQEEGTEGSFATILTGSGERKRNPLTLKLLRTQEKERGTERERRRKNGAQSDRSAVNDPKAAFSKSKNERNGVPPPNRIM
jgi:hypothetical protein